MGLGKKKLKVTAHTTVNKWTGFLLSNKLNPAEKVPLKLLVDLNAHMYLPYHVVSLACLIEEYYQKGSDIRFKKINSDGGRYLKRLGFLKYWKPGFNRDEYHPGEFRTAFCLWKIKPQMIHTYVVYSQNYYQQNFFSGKDLQPLNTSLAEVFNNIYDHSESQISGYVFSQYYPRKKQIVLSVCDFGLGIPKKINDYLQNENKQSVDPIGALLLALTLGFSTKSTPKNKGFGLHTIKTLIMSLKSEFLIISNNAYLKQLKDGTYEAFHLKQNFPGTQIVIYLDATRLQQNDLEEITDLEFNL